MFLLFLRREPILGALTKSIKPKLQYINFILVTRYTKPVDGPRQHPVGGTHTNTRLTGVSADTLATEQANPFMATAIPENDETVRTTTSASSRKIKSMNAFRAVLSGSDENEVCALPSVTPKSTYPDRMLRFTASAEQLRAMLLLQTTSRVRAQGQAGTGNDVMRTYLDI